MATKPKPSLLSALDAVTPAPVAATPTVETPVEPVKRVGAIPSRESTVLVGAHLPAPYGKALKLLSAETGQSQRDLIEEALKMLFVKKGARTLGIDI
ncbi:hypothetical protein ELG63_36355 [Rhizobium leguminosarum]|uniref:ribbon-helix-helix domain-containing protein n=1 Tax=Rhizobium leguminosarum TaxID=384 RepID=UPI00103212DC|nr:ribbon-helix-helix domain-containing protein [Rhizobium leguminosarum]MBY5819925.1 hypothetical protein [Rhizobium leguminosarum]TBH28162.1 hypothetical protein ELG63_36355 [Rhizobium leguminosarum]